MPAPQRAGAEAAWGSQASVRASRPAICCHSSGCPRHGANLGLCWASSSGCLDQPRGSRRARPRSRGDKHLLPGSGERFPGSVFNLRIYRRDGDGESGRRDPPKVTTESSRAGKGILTQAPGPVTPGQWPRHPASVSPDRAGTTSPLAGMRGCVRATR